MNQQPQRWIEVKDDDIQCDIYQMSQMLQMLRRDHV
jgi:hypothetical protein